MDTTTPPPLPTPPPPVQPIPSPRFLLPGAFLLTILADFFIWQGAEGGAPISCLFLVLAVAFACSAGRPRHRIWVYVALVALTTLQGFLEFKPTTFLVSSALLLTILGQVHFADINSLLGRSMEVALAALFPFPAWRRLRKIRIGGSSSLRSGEERQRQAWRIVQTVLPALVLGLVFALCFAEGNPIFQKLLGNAFNFSFDWLLHLNLSIGRIVFWGAAFTLLFSLLLPLRTGLGGWIAQRSIPRWTRRDEALGRLQSITVLALLNGLFFFVNTIDAIYLWGRQALPEGVNHSAFLHRGVESLIFAVILSAFVMVLLFQQRLAIGSRILQGLATAWVAQNVIIIAGVFLRLQLYVEEHQLTLLRVGVGLFLLLVIAGFGLLTVYFWQGRSLGWLIRSNVIATFALFFTVQFIDLEKEIAEYNVNRYLRGSDRVPDLEYLSKLGDSAWPSLLALHQQRPGLPGLRNALYAASSDAHRELATADWRRTSYLRGQRSWAVVQYLGKFPLAP